MGTKLVLQSYGKARVFAGESKAALDVRKRLLTGRLTFVFAHNYSKPCVFQRLSLCVVGLPANCPKHGYFVFSTHFTAELLSSSGVRRHARNKNAWQIRVPALMAIFRSGWAHG
jgi:hypothetical protein